MEYILTAVEGKEYEAMQFLIDEGISHKGTGGPSLGFIAVAPLNREQYYKAMEKSELHQKDGALFVAVEPNRQVSI